MLKSLRLLNHKLSVNYFPCKCVSSFLYVTGDKARDIYSAVQPHIDFDERIKNLAELESNFKKRKINLDANELIKLWDFYKTRLDFKRTLEVNKKEIQTEIKKLSSNKDNNQENNEIEALKLKFKLVKDDLKNISQTVWDIENNIVIKVLQLPNDLHSRASTDENIVNVFNTPPDFGRDHLECGITLNCLDYHCESSYFLKNDLAILEIGISQYFVDYFFNNKFIQFSNADFSRSVLIEGCTLRSEAPDIAFLLKDTEKDQKHKIYLNGGASYLSFFGFHSKHVVDGSNLPLRYVAQGRQYNPKPENNFNGLYSVWQSTAVELFIGTDNTNLTLELDNLVEKMTDLYKSLDIHFRLVIVPAHQLQAWESLKYSFQLYSPIHKAYIEVGNISLMGDFISKRLCACYSKDNKLNFLNVISGTAVKIPIMIAHLLETSKTDLFIPQVVRDKMDL